MGKACVALVDDHALIRGALARVLQDDPAAPGLLVIEEISLDKLCQRLGGGLEVDLVVLEASLPELHGLSRLAEFRDAYPTLPLLVMAETCDAALIAQCASIGVAGAVQKSGGARQIRAAVRAVLSGAGWMPEPDAQRFKSVPA